MSSRKSSRDSTPRISSKEHNDDSQANINAKVKNMSQSLMIGTFVISLIVQGSVLYYLYNLEDVDCNCIRDWRHNFCKGFALLVLAVGIIVIGFQHLNKALMIGYLILGLINAYAFFTYIGDLNATKCLCATNKQPNLNVAMRVYRWILLLGGISAVFQLVALLGLGLSGNK
jgi:vacuolar-type H+-ATPase subunit I/STV1